MDNLEENNSLIVLEDAHGFALHTGAEFCPVSDFFIPYLFYLAPQKIYKVMWNVLDK